jgi:FMN phosphatase YigB (HAD superfamily)
MFNSIIFDFGDIFIDLQKEKCAEAFRKIGLGEFNSSFQRLNEDFEVGLITEKEFLTGIQQRIPKSKTEDIRAAWNTLITGVPSYRLEFLKSLQNRYRIFLMTNTDKIHIEYFKEIMGTPAFNYFNSCFEKVYYSYEMGMRKPDIRVFSYIIEEQGLAPHRTLFVDDRKDNIEAAKSVGLRTWHLQVGSEDVTDLFSKKAI